MKCVSGSAEVRWEVGWRLGCIFRYWGPVYSYSESPLDRWFLIMKYIHTYIYIRFNIQPMFSNSSFRNDETLETHSYTTWSRSNILTTADPCVHYSRKKKRSASPFVAHVVLVLVLDYLRYDRWFNYKFTMKAKSMIYVYLRLLSYYVVEDPLGFFSKGRRM